MVARSRCASRAPARSPRSRASRLIGNAPEDSIRPLPAESACGTCQAGPRPSALVAEGVAVMVLERSRSDYVCHPPQGTLT